MDMFTSPMDEASKEKIISEIENGKGKQFDPEISEVVLKLIENDQLNIEE